MKKRPYGRELQESKNKNTRMIWVKYIKKRHFFVHFKNELVRSAFFVFLPCAHFGKERRKDFGAFLFEDAARHFHFMIE